MAAPILLIRPIRPADDPAIAAVIREVMGEHGCTGAGFAIHDAEVAAMHAAYRPADAAGYWVLEQDRRLLGGGGFARLAGTAARDGVSELRKMYFLPEARGQGAGRALLELLLDEMRCLGYRRCYLETTSWMDDARRLYLAAGFAELPAPLGATGHHGCDRWFARAL